MSVGILWGSGSQATVIFGYGLRRSADIEHPEPLGQDMKLEVEVLIWPFKDYKLKPSAPD